MIKHNGFTRRTHIGIQNDRLRLIRIPLNAARRELRILCDERSDADQNAGMGSPEQVGHLQGFGTADRVLAATTQTDAAI